MTGTSLGFAAAALLLAVGARWMQLMLQGRIRRVAPYAALNAGAALLGALALLRGPGLAGGIAAGIALAAGLAFLALYAASGQARTPAAVAPGDRVLDFVASDDAGRPFALASLRGRPFLLKFFRGHWCPYCVAELRRWQELRPALAAHDIAVVAICADQPEEIRRGRAKHGLDAIFVSDPQLAVTDLYRLRNPRNFAPRPGVIIPLPIPTTILVDAHGIVRWVDQASDYMVRTDPTRVRDAIRMLVARASAPANQIDHLAVGA
ncbi:MAG: peroxiredoxin family protein [Deltaproteobacteria bacterium]|nr:peroxiredoxin family protein [Deltaproteobacteria bacterium]